LTLTPPPPRSPLFPTRRSSDLVAPQGPAHDCNEGFIRDDAILVVTFITDEDDNQGDGSAGTPDGWKAALVSAKKGDDAGIVVLEIGRAHVGKEWTSRGARQHER